MSKLRQVDWKLLRSGLRRFGRQVDRPDLLITAAFAAFAILFFLDVFRGDSPYVYLKHDASNYAAIAAALDHPEHFAGDAAFDDPEKIRSYLTIHVPMLRLLARVVGDYGTAFIILLPIHVFLQALGFYVLGRVLFASRYWAALLAIINLAPIWLGFGTYWGIDTDALPRFTFQALLPFLLAAALRWREEPLRWPWIMVGVGLLIYVHPIGAPGWGFALWFSLFFARPPQLTPRRHVLYLFLLGMLFLLICAPFLLKFLDNTQNTALSGTAGPEYEEVSSHLHKMFGVEYLDIPNGLRRFVRRWSQYKLLLWLVAAAGVIFLARASPRDRQRLGMVVDWVSGLGLIFVIVPYALQEICRARGILPIEMELIRGIRFLVPLMLLFCLWPLAAAERLYKPPAGWWWARTAGALLVGLWLFWHPPIGFGNRLENWHSRSAVLPEERSERLEALDAVRRLTPLRSRILAQELQMELRYYALRPLVYAAHDKGPLIYSDLQGFLRWSELYWEMRDIETIKTPLARYAALCGVGARLDADYLLLRHEDLPAPHGPPETAVWREVWRNRRYVLVSRSRTGNPVRGSVLPRS